MSGSLAPLTFARLLDGIRRERDTQGTIFGLHVGALRTDLRGRPFASRRHHHLLDAPIGVAAGPHTQLSQNIVAAWLCGARVLELKTVQVKDDLVIDRPCIDMQDEGYNVEWSQELPLEASFAQYADAWTAIRLLQAEAGGAGTPECGFLMDASVGYDLAGITSAPMQRYLDRLTDCRADVAARLAAAVGVWARAGDVEPPAALTRSVTLSTMHGCPPGEIERIASHLMADRGLHTTVKLNPTLLGVQELHALLNDTLGYGVTVPSAICAGDLPLDEAVDLLRALRSLAARTGVSFGVKLTNTLPCRNMRSVLRGEVAYLSGRALHPVAVQVALRLQEAFAGELDVSFSGGADAHNVVPLLACGLRPVTACSDLLRPGGVLRLAQYIDLLDQAMTTAGASDLDAFASGVAGEDDRRRSPATLHALRRYAGDVLVDPRYRKDAYPERSTKSRRPLGAFDCIAAPCLCACPVGQDIPELMFHLGRGDEPRALAAALRDNPFPGATGAVCHQPCQERCTRVHLDAGLRIRALKRHLGAAATPPPLPPAAPRCGRTVAIVGAGPAGLACGWFLALAGVEVTVFEAGGEPGGLLAGTIPTFRLAPAAVGEDLRRVAAAGVKVRAGERIDAARLAALRRDHDAVFVAVGAQSERLLDIPGEDLPGVWHALGFLAAARRGDLKKLTGEVIVIGGGDTAMDAARTAARLVGAPGAVRLVYRRTAAEMPAGREQLAAARAEGVVIHERWAPATIAARDGRLALTCRRMRPGEPDGSGRCAPVPDPGQTECYIGDTIIVAVGHHDASGLAKPLGDGVATAFADVFVGGDARRAPGTVADAVADGRRAADTILASFGLPTRAFPAPARRLDPLDWQRRAATVVAPHDDPTAEAGRCLACDLRCDVCVSVCPNRANVAYAAPLVRWPLVVIRADADGWSAEPDGVFAIEQERQTCHVVDVCNECGNCTTFCPADGAPWRDKPRFALAPATYADGDDIYHLQLRGGELVLRHREGSEESTLVRRGDALVFTTGRACVTLAATSFTVREVATTGDGPLSIGLRRAAAMAVLLHGLAGGPLAPEA